MKTGKEPRKCDSVLPTFIRYSRAAKPQSIAKPISEIQIVDTHVSLGTRISIGSTTLQH